MKRIFGILSLAVVLAVTTFGQTSSTHQGKTQKLSNKELISLIATAKTPAEHRRIAEYFKAEAQDYLAQSKDHEQMAEAYKKNPVLSNDKFHLGTVNHCEYLAQHFKEVAAQFQELAEIHEKMAQGAENK
jgi:hypothetical protein